MTNDSEVGIVYLRIYLTNITSYINKIGNSHLSLEITIQLKKINFCIHILIQ